LEDGEVPGDSELKVFSTDASAITWEERPNPKNGMSSYMKTLHQDAETGVRVSLNFYPKGFVTKWHTHPCAHGMYVLEGILKTHEGVYGPGSFVWFPEGSTAEHGATAETDVLTLFITNKPFDITYKD
jgi:quercetin dioxygenase-like cupin family protein